MKMQMEEALAAKKKCIEEMENNFNEKTHSKAESVFLKSEVERLNTLMKKS
jgi:hypothetical protein